MFISVVYLVISVRLRKEANLIALLELRFFVLYGMLKIGVIRHK